MATIKELLSAMIDKINGNEDKIDNIKGVPEAFDSITMTNGTDMANLTMSAEKKLLFNGEPVGGGSSGATNMTVVFTATRGDIADVTTDADWETVKNALVNNELVNAYIVTTDVYNTACIPCSLYHVDPADGGPVNIYASGIAIDRANDTDYDGKAVNCYRIVWTSYSITGSVHTIFTIS